MGNALQSRRDAMFIENMVNILLNPVGVICYSIGMMHCICRSYGAKELC